MELRDYTPDEIDALIDEIETGQMRRDGALDPLIAEFDIPRDEPELNERDSKLATLLDSLGRRKESYHDPVAANDGRPVLTAREPRLGDALRTNVYNTEAFGQLADFVDYLGKPYQVSGAQFVEDGLNAANEGYDERDALKTAGGVGMMAMPMLPYTRAGSKMFSTIPRSALTGGAMAAAPLAAEEAFSPTTAYAANEDTDIIDKGKPFIPVALAAALGGVLGGITKGAMKGHAQKLGQEASDIDRILANREIARSAKDNVPVTTYQKSVDRELKEIEPLPYRHKDGLALAKKRDLYQDAATEDMKNLDTAGVLTGGVGGGIGYGIQSDEIDPWQFMLSTIGGGAVGAAMPAFKGGSRKLGDQSTIGKYAPPRPENLPRKKARFSMEHNPGLREKTKERLLQGESPEILSVELDIPVNTLKSWGTRARKAQERKLKKLDKE